MFSITLRSLLQQSPRLLKQFVPILLFVLEMMDQSNCTHEQHLSSLGMVKSLGEEGDCFRILLNRILHHAFSDQFAVQGVAVIRIALNCLFVNNDGWLELVCHEVGVGQVYVYVLQQFL